MRFCTKVSELAAYEVPHYYEQINERKKYFDILTGEDVWDYLVERDFQKRFFQQWAELEKMTFCSQCSARDECEISRASRLRPECLD